MGEVTEKQTMTLRGLVPCPTNTRLLTVCPVISIQSRSPNVFDRIFTHNGYVRVNSDVGNGTVFKLYIPLTNVIQSEASEKKVREELPRGNGNILLAEDDPTILKMLGKLLEDNGYTVYSAMDGVEAIKVFLENKENIEIIITDVIMPRKNGRDVYEEINSLKPHIPVIYLSGYHADLLNEQGAMCESVNYFSKPLNPLTLLTKIRDVLQHG